MAPSIPDRWIPYKACGKVIEGTRFICFKVPIRKTVQVANREITEIWDIPTLLRTIPKLGAVIDLTNTAKYYNPKELQKAGILHRKILMPGHILPPESKVKEFMDAVDEFLGKDCVAVQVRRACLGVSTTDALVGVHCTHGLNRTGYMVCRYMRDRLCMLGIDAIKKFEIARGYKIERSNYVADLIGKKPPPPNFEKPTTIVPVNGECSSVDTDREFLSNKLTDESNYGCNGGQYVRHPKYVIRNTKKSNRINYSKDRRKSTDLDRPYDYKHDY